MKTRLVFRPYGGEGTSRFNIDIHTTKITHHIEKKFPAQFPYPKLSAGSVEPMLLTMEARMITEGLEIEGYLENQDDYDDVVSAIRKYSHAQAANQIHVYVVSDNATWGTQNSTTGKYSPSGTGSYIHHKWEADNSSMGTGDAGGGLIIRFRSSIERHDRKNDENYIARYHVFIGMIRGRKIG
jgi:hypothetical protein